MTKQDWLDKETENNQEWVTQQMLINMSKTELAQIKRAINRIHQVAYKSWAKTLPLNEISEAVSIAEEVARTEKEANNETMAITNNIRRRRNG